MTKNRSEQKGEDEFIQLKATGTFNITLSVFNCVILNFAYNPDNEICIMTSDWCSFLHVFAY